MLFCISNSCWLLFGNSNNQFPVFLFMAEHSANKQIFSVKCIEFVSSSFANYNLMEMSLRSVRSFHLIWPDIYYFKNNTNAKLWCVNIFIYMNFFFSVNNRDNKFSFSFPLDYYCLSLTEYSIICLIVEVGIKFYSNRIVFLKRNNKTRSSFCFECFFCFARIKCASVRRI